MRCIFRMCIYTLICLYGNGMSARDMFQSCCHKCTRRPERHQQRVHKPHEEAPIYAAMYDSAVSEFARLLREYDVITNVHVPITIFAPNNVVLPLARIRQMDPEQIRRLLRRHIVAGYMLPHVLADRAQLRTLHGTQVAFTRDDEDLTIADVDIQRHRETPHAVIYHINGVIEDD